MTLSPFDTIAGSSLGQEPRQSIIELLTFALNFELNRTTIDTDSIIKIFNELKDLAELVDDRDAHEQEYLDCASDLVAELLDEDLPGYCSFEWVDNEYRITPNVEAAIAELPKGDELPDMQQLNRDYCQSDYFVVINERGNTTLYKWSDSRKRKGWSEVWGIV